MNYKNSALIERYLLEAGYEVHHHEFGESPCKKFMLVKSPSGKTLMLSESALILPFATSSTNNLRADKHRSYDYAKHIGLRIPDTLYVDVHTYDDYSLVNMLNKHGRLIVKPHNGYQSRGLTTGITTLQGLHEAFRVSSELSDVAIVQEEVVGDEVRIVVVDGKVRAALLRQSPRVVGDGSSTIAQLIKKENKDRETIANSLVPYPQLDSRLIDVSLLNSETVPANGAIVQLSRKSMIRDGASVYNVLDTMHPSYIELAEKAACNFGRGLSCVDVMIQDYTEQAGDNYAFIEFNGAISIALCYSCRDGKPFRLLDDYLGPMLIKAIE